MKLHFKFKKTAKTYKFTWFFIALVMLSMIITVTIELIVLLVLQSAGSIKVDDIGTWGLWPFIIFAVTSVILGFGASAIVSIIPIRPVADIIDGLNELSTGNYNARIDLGKHKSLKSVADAFNSLATELGNTEMLRSYLNNNFTHKYKTPNLSISDGGKISVSVAGDARIICATITNYGAEIPSESLGKIFNKFYQGDTSHASRGNGIGLSIVKRIVDLHGGTVTVNSGDGKTVFAVTLPAPPEACPLPPQGKQPAATAKKSAKKGQRSPKKPPAKSENKDK